MRRNGVVLLLVLSVVGTLSAQEATEEPGEGLIIETAWLIIDAEAAEDTDPHHVLFLSLDEGTTLIEVAAGADLIYTLGEDSLYSGAPLIPTDAYEYQSTLDMVEDDLWQVDSVTTTTNYTFERSLTFERTDLDYGVWVEGDRDLSEYSMFGECMGRVDVSPPAAFANPDPILPIRIDDEAGTLTIGNTVLTGGGGSYERVDEDAFGALARVITQTATVTEESITFTYHAIADGRDDCELRYETSFLPFDGDYDQLFSRAEDLGDEE